MTPLELSESDATIWSITYWQLYSHHLRSKYAYNKGHWITFGISEKGFT